MKGSVNGVEVIRRGADRPAVWSGKLARYPLEKGDLVRLKTGTGGGYGSALDRDPKLVRQDVVNGFLSVEQARRIYGVVLEGMSRGVDLSATKRLDLKHKNVGKLQRRSLW